MTSAGAGSVTESVADRFKKKPGRRFSKGLVVDPVFCPADVADPFDTVEWDTAHRRHQGRGGRGAVRADRLRSSRRRGANWPRTSCVSKYFYGEVGTPRARERACGS